MKFQPIIAALVLVTSVHGQENKGGDPYATESAAPGGAVGDAPRNVSVCYEAFSVPLAMAAKLQRDGKTDPELYAALAGGAEKDGIRQESFSMIRMRSGEKAKVESISEQIYPTEFEPPELPNTVGVSIATPEVKDAPAPPPDAGKLKGAPAMGDLDNLRTPATPTSFDTRNVGLNLEIEATMSDDPKDPMIDLRMVPDQTTRAGRVAWGQGLSTSELPVFECQRLSTSVTTRANKPALVGTMNRPPVSEIDPDSAKRVWFAFVTVTIVKP